MLHFQVRFPFHFHLIIPVSEFMFSERYSNVIFWPTTIRDYANKQLYLARRHFSLKSCWSICWSYKSRSLLHVLNGKMDELRCGVVYTHEADLCRGGSATVFGCFSYVQHTRQSNGQQAHCYFLVVVLHFCNHVWQHHKSPVPHSTNLPANQCCGVFVIFCHECGQIWS